MKSQTIILICYHGTSISNAESIVKTKRYLVNGDNTDWLGKGVYFFIAKNKSIAIQNAIEWAVYFKKLKRYAVIKTRIDTQKERIVDLNDEEWQEVFHKIREVLLKKAEESGSHIESEVIELDNNILDDICKNYNIVAVIQQKYINFKKNYWRATDKGSYIPNCKIICIKDLTIINKSSIEEVRRGVI